MSIEGRRKIAHGTRLTGPSEQMCYIEDTLGGCPRIGIDRFIAPAKPALPPSMAVVAKGGPFEASFLII